LTTTGTDAPRPLQRPRQRQKAGLPEQPLRPACADRLRPLQKPLAGRIVFKWIKQHLRIKQFYGTSENAVKTQIWIAISVYVLVAIVKKKLNLEASLYTLLQILSVTLFEKMSLQQALTASQYKAEDMEAGNQLDLFGFLTGH
jgi:hypothetical protein